MILVTGATGFLGANLLQHLSRLHQPVRALMRHPDRVPASLRLPHIEWVQADVLDVVSLEEAMQGVNEIYHAAAIVSFEARDHKPMMQVNVTGTANVVNAALAAGVKRLLHVSSIAALGRSGTESVITENATWRGGSNNSVYALSKYLAEREVWRGTQEGLPAVIANPCTVIGQGDWLRGTPRLFHACRRGMPVYPRGANAFVAVDDVSQCLIRLMNSNAQSERFIVSSENISFRQLFTWITQTLGTQQPRFALPRWATGVGWRVSSLLHRTLGVYPLLTRETARTVNNVYCYSNDKIRQRLNYDFVPAQTFVVETARAYKSSVTPASASLS